MKESFIQLFLTSGIQLLYLVGMFIAVGFLLGYLEKYSNSFLITAFGQKGVLGTAYIGTPVHEFGHALMCVIFRHRIIKVKWLQFGDPDGVLGYVQHSYNPRSVYQRIGSFFIGLGPIFSGIGALILSMYLLVPDTYKVIRSYYETEVTAGQINKETITTMFGACKALWASLFSVESFTNPLFWVFLVLAICISSHIALSTADIKESTSGLIMMFVLIFLFNLVANYAGFDSLELVKSVTTYNAYLLAFASIAIFFSTLTFVISFLILKIRTR